MKRSHKSSGMALLFIAAAFTCLFPRQGSAQGSELRVKADRIASRIEELSKYGRNSEGGVDRVAFSQSDIDGRAVVIGWMREAGLETAIDPAGNILGRAEGKDPRLPSIMFGSHTDSVPGGGNYDGALGVIAAIEVAEVLHENGIRTRHPLEVVVFCDEEGGLTGSRAMIGELGENGLGEKTHSGLTRGAGIVAIGGNIAKLSEVRRSRGDIKAFLELHIEQGAVLDDEGIDIGIVEGIVGIEWWDVVIDGAANHAGTTPMNKRRDALLAAARYVEAVNEVVRSVPGSQVGTVGKIGALPGAHNVIPGRVTTSLEIRDLSSEKIMMLYQKILQKVKTIEDQTGTKFTFTQLGVSAVPAIMAGDIQEAIRKAAGDLGLSWKSMPSGAGHDAQDMARIAPTGMIFVPSEGGISHSPKEFTTKEDMRNGADVLLQTVLAIDRSAQGNRP
jgi:N-carbamoyl-L-amino-acid hydrolase